MQINEPKSVKRHSRLGIASTILGGGLPLLVIVLIIFTATFEKIGNETEVKLFKSLFDVSLAILAFVLLSAPMLHLTGLILGVIGAFSKETKKIFPVVGIAINSLLGLIGFGIMYFLFTYLRFRIGAFR